MRTSFLIVLAPMTLAAALSGCLGARPTQDSDAGAGGSPEPSGGASGAVGGHGGGIVDAGSKDSGSGGAGGSGTGGKGAGGNGLGGSNAGGSNAGGSSAGGSNAGGNGAGGNGAGGNGVGGTGAGGTAAGGNGAGGKALFANGHQCGLGTDCTLGHCVDGVCCNTACAGLCNSCLQAFTGTPDGTCGNTRAGATGHAAECVADTVNPCGNDGTCDGLGACRKYGTTKVCLAASCSSSLFKPAATCDGKGGCPTTTSVNCTPYQCTATGGCMQTCTADNQCLGNVYCDLVQHICAPKKIDGTLCGGGNECVSSNCIDGVCCNGLCNGTCLSCLGSATGQANGVCASILPGTDPNNECTKDAVNACGLDGFCDGSGGCRKVLSGTTCMPATCSTATQTLASTCDGFGTCSTAQPQACPGSLTCVPASVNCRTSCTTGTDCIANNFCAATTCHLTATQLAAGNQHVCALLSDGTVRCWGTNYFGESGAGPAQGFAFPRLVTGLTGATAISAGNFHTCALVSGGRVMCWGTNTNGQVGDGTTNSSTNVPVAVSGITTAVAVAAGGSSTCARLSNNTIRCWGDNFNGDLGNGIMSTDPSAATPTPVTVTGINNAAAVSVGAFYACAVLTDGTIRCWGNGNGGTLGNGSFNPSPLPVTVSGITTATAISAGGNSVCALLADKTVRCWGVDLDGELGDGMTGSNIPTPSPVTVMGLANVQTISVGTDSACALLTDGTARCWGLNDNGQLGNNSLITAPTPVAVSGLQGLLGITAGAEVSCALASDRSARCWGADDVGELGNGGTARSLVPVAVLGW